MIEKKENDKHFQGKGGKNDFFFEMCCFLMKIYYDKIYPNFF